MFNVQHIQQGHNTKRGSSKYLAAIQNTEHPVTIRQIMHVVGLMTGAPPSRQSTVVCVRNLVENGQVIKHADGTYTASDH